MWEDPIVAEVHRIRREIFARFNGDMAAYARHLSAVEEEERRRGRTIIDTPLRKPQKPNAGAA
jgi:uncharacterized protein (DUF2461 family)